MSRVALLSSFLLLAVVVFAQQPSAPPEASTVPAATASTAQPSRADVMKLLELIHARDRVDQIQRQYAEYLAQTAVPGVKFSSLTPDQQARLNDAIAASVGDIRAAYPPQQLLDLLASVYQQRLTQSDVQACIQFFSTTPGQKFLNEVGAMMNSAVDQAKPAFFAAVKPVTPKIQERVRSALAGPSAAAPASPN